MPTSDVAARISDSFEALTSTQTSRTGQSAARIASALANNVDPEVVALQTTKNSRKNNPQTAETFTADDMQAIAKLHRANSRRSAFTKQQAGELIRLQKHDDAEGVPAPA